MKFFNLFQNDLKRGILSRSFLLSTLGIIFFLLLNIFYNLGDMHLNKNDLFMDTIQPYDGYGIIAFFVLPAVPFGMSFAKEWTDRSYLFYTARAGSTRYILSKFLTSAISGFLTLLLGIWSTMILIYLLIPDMPLWNTVNGLWDGLFYADFLQSGHTFFAYFLFALNRAFAGALVAVISLLFSTYVANPIASLAAPLIIDFTVTRIEPFWGADGAGLLSGTKWERYGNLYYYIGGIYTEGTVGRILFDRVVMIGGACLILGIWTLIHTKRRLRNG